VKRVSRVLGIASTSGTHCTAAQHSFNSGVSSSESMEHNARSVLACIVSVCVYACVCVCWCVCSVCLS